MYNLCVIYNTKISVLCAFGSFWYQLLVIFNQMPRKLCFVSICLLSHHHIKHHHQHEAYGETYGAEVAVLAA